MLDPPTDLKFKGEGQRGARQAGRGMSPFPRPPRGASPRSAPRGRALPVRVPRGGRRRRGGGGGGGGGGRRRGGERARPPPSCDPAAAPARPRPRQRRGPAPGGHRARSAGGAAPTAPCHACVPAAGCRAAALLSSPPALSAAGRGGQEVPGLRWLRARHVWDVSAHRVRCCQKGLRSALLAHGVLSPPHQSRMG